MFFWGMLTGCAVVCVGSVLASIFMNWSSKKKKKGKIQNVSEDKEKVNDKSTNN